MLQGNFFLIEKIVVDAGKISASLTIDRHHKIFEGHFPGSPVVPGVCMMQIVKEVLENVLARGVNLRKADHMKFLSVLNPNQTDSIVLEATYAQSEENITLVARLFNGDTSYFKFKGSFA